MLNEEVNDIMDDYGGVALGMGFITKGTKGPRDVRDPRDLKDVRD